jgi:hypothetical protein
VPQVRTWFMNLGLSLEFFAPPTQNTVIPTGASRCFFFQLRSCEVVG